MRKNYFAKKFVAYSMAFAVAFSTLTVSPVFVREAKAANTGKAIGNIKVDKAANVAAITDLTTGVTSTTVYDGAVLLSTLKTDDAVNGTGFTKADFLGSANFGFQDDAETISNLKAITLEPASGKIGNTAEKNYNLLFVDDEYGVTDGTDPNFTNDEDKLAVIGHVVSPIKVTDPSSKVETISMKASNTIYDASVDNASTIIRAGSNGGIWFKLVKNEGTFKYNEVDGTPATSRDDTITYEYFTLVKKADVTAGDNVALTINKEVDDDYGIYMYVDKGAGEDGTNVHPTTLNGTTDVKAIINVCKGSNFTATANKGNVYAAKGAKATLAVDVTPETANTIATPVTYTWSKGGKTLDSKEATLSIAEVKDADYGIYKCVVTDGMKTTNVNITLKELTADVVSNRDDEITTVKKVLANGTTFAAGDDKYKLPTGKITLTTSLPSGDYHYIWTKADGATKVDLTSSNALTYDSTNKTITITNEADDATKASFTCKVFAVPTSKYNTNAGIKAALKKLSEATNDADKYAAIDNVGGLRAAELALVGDAVNTEVFTFAPANDATVLESETELVKLGDELKLTAPSYADAASYSWTTADNRTYTSANLTINTLDQQDLGTITCVVTKKDSNTVTKNFNVLCNSDVAATAENVTAKVGQKNVDLQVTATSTLPVKHTWYKQVYNTTNKVFEDPTDPDNPAVLPNTNTDQSKFTIAEVINNIDDPTTPDGDFYIGEKAKSYQYMCEVTDGINTIQVPVRVGQIETYKIYENQAKLDAGEDIAKETAGYTVNVADYKGNKVSLSPIVVAASADIEKELKYQWTKDGVNLSTDKSIEVECTDTATTYVLTVSEGTLDTSITYVVQSLKDEDLKAVTDIGDVNKEVEKSVIYTGEEINPVTRVYVVTAKGTYTLKAGTDYTVELTDAVNAGVSLYKVVLTGNFADAYNKSTNNAKNGLGGTFTITRAENEVEIADTTVALGTSVQPKTVKNLGKSALTYTYYADADCTTEIEVPTKVGTYYVKATAEVSNNYTAATSNVAKVTVAPGTTKIGNTSRTASSITLNWSKVTGATKYRVFIKTSTGWKTLGYTDKLSFTKKDLASATTYTFAVKAYAGSVASSKYVSRTTTTAPAKVSTLAVKAKGSRKVAISYSKVTRATGYQVYMAKGNGSYKKVAQGKLTAITKSKLTKGATYKFKVRAYKTVGSNTYYGAFSSAKAVKVK